jgi:hypothetical protein
MNTKLKKISFAILVGVFVFAVILGIGNDPAKAQNVILLHSGPSFDALTNTYAAGQVTGTTKQVVSSRQYLLAIGYTLNNATSAVVVRNSAAVADATARVTLAGDATKLVFSAKNEANKTEFIQFNFPPRLVHGIQLEATDAEICIQYANDPNALYRPWGN